MSTNIIQCRRNDAKHSVMHRNSVYLWQNKSIRQNSLLIVELVNYIYVELYAIQHKQFQESTLSWPVVLKTQRARKKSAKAKSHMFTYNAALILTFVMQTTLIMITRVRKHGFHCIYSTYIVKMYHALRPSSYYRLNKQLWNSIKQLIFKLKIAKNLLVFLSINTSHHKYTTM
jgi:hypothetical protein